MLLLCRRRVLDCFFLATKLRQDISIAARLSLDSSFDTQVNITVGAKFSGTEPECQLR